MDKPLVSSPLQIIRLMRPVRVLPDHSLGDAHRFGFDALAKTLARIILDPANRTPLTIGIHGAWGSGKTSLMETTRKTVDAVSDQLERNASDLRRCRTVWFNAWKYAGEEALLAALVEEIINQMKREGFLEARLAEIAELKGKINWASVSGSLTKLLSGGIVDIERFVQQSEQKKRLPYLLDFQQSLDQLLRFYVTGRRDEEGATDIDDREGVLAVFIDDLDRCQADRVVQLLETLKLFMDKAGCVFVLGMDCALVEQAVKARYKDLKDFDAHFFMSKILQLRFNLPPIRGEEIESYVKEDLKAGEQLEKYLHLVTGAIERNPREVKRFVSSFTIQRSLAEARGLLSLEGRSDSETGKSAARMDEELLAKWTVLEFAFERFITWVKKRPLRIVQMQEEIRRQREAQKTMAEGKLPGYEPPSELREFLSNPRLQNVLAAGKQFPNDEEAINLYIHQSAALAMARAQAPAQPVAVTGRPGEMVLVPAGEFTMGTDDGLEDECPAHRVFVSDFYIGAHPVTNAQYAEFVKATGRRAPYHWKDGAIPEGLDDHPVVSVGWHDAVAYCRWRSEQTGAVYRLPTEAEWEKAARGTDGRAWPWGNEFDPEKCNTAEGRGKGTTPVTQFPEGRSPYGCYDMAGNVWEWTSSLYRDYPYKADDGRENPEAEGRRVLRGGSWFNMAGSARSAYRGKETPDYAHGAFGFRCVRAPQGSPQT